MATLKSLFSFAFKDLFGQKKIFLFLILNLITGTFGFLLVQFFQSSLKVDLERRATDMLGASYTITSNRILTNEQVSQYEKNMVFEDKASLTEFFAMIKSGDRSRLVSVRAFGKGYPFFGKLTDSQGSLDHDLKAIWVDPEILNFLLVDSKKTNELELGRIKFKDVRILEQDSSRFFRGAGFAPVVYISEKYLSETELISLGSTLRSYLLYKNTNEEQVLKQKEQFNNIEKDSTIRYETAKERSESSNRVFKYFTDYLGLVAIVSIALCFLAGGYLMRWIFDLQKINIAIYKTLGMTDGRIQFIQFFNVLLVSLVSYAVSFLIIVSLFPLLNNIFSNNNLPFQLMLTWESVGLSLLISITAPLIMFLPMLWSISNLNPKDLFQNRLPSQESQYKQVIWYVSCIVYFLLISFLQSRSYSISALFTFSVIGFILVLNFIFRLVFNIFNKFITSLSSWKMEYAVKAIVNRKQSSSLIFVTFAGAFLVLVFLPHIKSSILSEIRPDNTSQLPRLFMFDIQTHQKPGLQAEAQKELGEELEFIPMIRAKILKVNETDYSRIDINSEGIQTREDEEEMRFRNRGVNLTYQTELKPSEQIIKGKWNPEPYRGHGLPEVSLEKRYAERIRAGLGDKMTFDIQGLEIQAVVTSIRTVRWTSFTPNFFIVFQAGVLEEAPQNYLAAVITNKDYTNFQKKLTLNFGNVSVIDVRSTVENTLVFVNQMALALQVMALVSIILGFFIFVILINTQLNERTDEFNLLKVLGLNTEGIKTIIGLQFSILITLSVLFGTALSFLLAYVLIEQIFNISVTYDYITVSLLLVSLIPIVYIIVRQSTRKLDRLSPSQLIRS